MRRTFLATIAALALTPLTSQAQQQPAETGDLQKATQNPVAELISVPFQNNTNFGIGPFSRDQNNLSRHAKAMAKANSADRRFADGKYRSDAHWDFALRLDADDPDAFWNLLDERASWFYEAVGAGAAMAPKRPGPSSAYLSAYTDNAGRWLDGGTSYRLRVPPNSPIKLFWSVTVYDVDTRALILNDQKIADRSSRMDLRKNADGSVDIYCGPKAPAGFEKNWIPTVSGKNWFAYFRFYQPTEAYFDRSWPLPDFEQVSTDAGVQHTA